MLSTGIGPPGQEKGQAAPAAFPHTGGRLEAAGGLLGGCWEAAGGLLGGACLGSQRGGTGSLVAAGVRET